MTAYLLQIPPGGEDELTLRARRLLDQAVLIVAGDEARARLERLGIRGGVPLCSPTDAGPAAVASMLREAGDRPVAWAVPGLAGWPEAERVVLGTVLAAGLKVVPVPGSAPWIACLAASGLPSDRFTFLGPMPVAAAARRAQLQRYGPERHTLIWELPAEALPAALRDAVELLGNRSVALCSASGIWRGKLDQAPHSAAGALLVVEGAGEAGAWTEQRVRERVRQLLAEGATTRDVARDVADEAGWSRRRVYDIALEVGAGQDG